MPIGLLVIAFHIGVFFGKFGGMAIENDILVSNKGEMLHSLNAAQAYHTTTVTLRFKI